MKSMKTYEGFMDVLRKTLTPKSKVNNMELYDLLSDIEEYDKLNNLKKSTIINNIAFHLTHYGTLSGKNNIFELTCSYKSYEFSFSGYKSIDMSLKKNSLEKIVERYVYQAINLKNEVVMNFSKYVDDIIDDSFKTLIADTCGNDYSYIDKKYGYLNVGNKDVSAFTDKNKSIGCRITVNASKPQTTKCINEIKEFIENRLDKNGYIINEPTKYNFNNNLVNLIIIQK